MSSVDPQQFWERKILKWERVRYSKWASAYPISWSIRNRLRTASEIVHQRASADWRLVELGCGSGVFANLLQNNFGHYFGLDIAKNAIELATERIQKPGFYFQAADVRTEQIPKADLTIFLGLTDWLNFAELELLFQRIHSRNILFSYTDSRKLTRINPYRWYRSWADRSLNRTNYRARSYEQDQIQSLLCRNNFSFEGFNNPTVNNPGVLVWGARQ